MYPTYVPNPSTFLFIINIANFARSFFNRRNLSRSSSPQLNMYNAEIKWAEERVSQNGLRAAAPFKLVFTYKRS